METVEMFHDLAQYFEDLGVVKHHLYFFIWKDDLFVGTMDLRNHEFLEYLF